MCSMWPQVMVPLTLQGSFWPVQVNKRHNQGWQLGGQAPPTSITSNHIRRKWVPRVTKHYNQEYQSLVPLVVVPWWHMGPMFYEMAACHAGGLHHSCIWGCWGRPTLGAKPSAHRVCNLRAKHA
jgi:hypothetical protein